MITFNCPHCGLQLQVEDDRAGWRGACPSCRQPIEVPAASVAAAPGQPPSAATVGPVAAPPRPAPTSGWSIAAFVCGLLGCTIIGGLLAIIFAILGFRAAKRGRKGRGFAIAGLVLGLLWIVIWILGIVFIVFAAREAVEAAKPMRTWSQTQELATHVQRFCVDQGRYPTEAEGLDALIHKPAGATHWPTSGYLRSPQLLEDPWGNNYHYFLRTTPTGEQPEVISYGSDGRPGGAGNAADISNLGKPPASPG